jgi:hypothetical protein
MCIFNYIGYLIYEGVSKSFRTDRLGVRTANGTAFCHWVQSCRYFMSQSVILLVTLFIFGKGYKLWSSLLWCKSRDSSVCIATRIGVLGFDSQRGLRIFLFITASRTALGPTQPDIQWVPGALSLGVKRPGREADHSPPSSAEIKECVELYLHSPIRLHGVAPS